MAMIRGTDVDGCAFFNSKAAKVRLIERQGYVVNYEIHGSGPKKLLFVMGFKASFGLWNSLLHHYAGQNPSLYSCLLIENRGVGKSTDGY